MPTYYSREYRIKISRAFLRHRNVRSVAKMYGVSVNTVYRAAHEFTTFKFKPGNPKLTEEGIRLIRCAGYHVRAKDLAEVLGVSASTISLTRRALGIMRKIGGRGWQNDD